jgi:hypothetical protein
MTIYDGVPTGRPGPTRTTAGSSGAEPRKCDERSLRCRGRTYHRLLPAATLGIRPRAWLLMVGPVRCPSAELPADAAVQGIAVMCHSRGSTKRGRPMPGLRPMRVLPTIRHAARWLLVKVPS